MRCTTQLLDVDRESFALVLYGAEKMLGNVKTEAKAGVFFCVVTPLNRIVPPPTEAKNTAHS